MTNATTNASPPSDLDPAPLEPADTRPVFAKAVMTAAAAIGAVTADQLGLPTPCDDFAVRQLLGHMADVMARVVLIGQGGDPMAIDPVDPAAVADDGWLDLFLGRAHEGRDAWAEDASLARTVVLPWATMPGAAALAAYTNELTVHTWDLAAATGQQPVWDDEVVAVALAAIQRGLPAGNRQALFESVIATMPEAIRPTSAPYAEAIEVSAEAPMIDQLVAWTGRRP